MKDVYNLQRFIDAQKNIFGEVLKELSSGQKRGHWMWYVFPQIKGLGHSLMAQRFAISSQAEAIAYSEHQILGTRLRQCTELVNFIVGRNIKQIFYYPDNLKFHSSMTLFMVSSTDNKLFEEALNKYFMGELDKSTLRILNIK